MHEIVACFAPVSGYRVDIHNAPLRWIPGRYTYVYAAARGIYRERGVISWVLYAVDAVIGRRICLIYWQCRQVASVRAIMHIHI